MKHDENKDLVNVSRIVRVNYSDKTLQTSKAAHIGIHTWGRIDYLVKHCGWIFLWNNNVNVKPTIIKSDTDSYNTHKREAKKAAKENTLTNKKRR